MKRAVLLLVVCTAAIACLMDPVLNPVSAAGAADVTEGTFLKKDKHAGNASLEIKRSGERWHISADVGGVPDGAATHADCFFALEGTLSGEQFKGRVLSEDDQKGGAATPEISFGFSIANGRITVRGADQQRALCDGEDGIVIDGTYAQAGKQADKAAATPIAFAQGEVPRCSGFGADTEFSSATLYEIQPGERVSFTCPSSTVLCKKNAFVLPGDMVIGTRAQGDQVCAEYIGPKKPFALTAGWLPKTRLAATSPKAAWVGTWIADEDMTITATAEGGQIRLKGRAIVELGSGRREGHFTGLVAPGEVTARIGYYWDGSETDPYGGKIVSFDEPDKAGLCKVEMAQLGPYLVVKDNEKCGGINVNFTGVYRRASGK